MTASLQLVLSWKMSCNRRTRPRRRDERGSLHSHHV